MKRADVKRRSWPPHEAEELQIERGDLVKPAVGVGGGEGGGEEDHGASRAAMRGEGAVEFPAGEEVVELEDVV